MVRHNEETDNLIQSDYELLKGEPAPIFTDDGPLTALIVDFCLPSSTYATMVLREILKLDTSPANQARLNKIASDEIASGDKRKLNNELSDSGDENDDQKRRKITSEADTESAQTNEEETIE